MILTVRYDLLVLYLEFCIITVLLTFLLVSIMLSGGWHGQF